MPDWFSRSDINPTKKLAKYINKLKLSLLQVMNREARRLEKEIKEVLEEMSSDEEIKVKD